MTFRFLTAALVEIREAAEYDDQRVSGLGADFLDEVEAAVERMLQFPEAWGKLGNEYRRCHLRRFPYSIIHSIQADQEIVVGSVFHQSRGLGGRICENQQAEKSKASLRSLICPVWSPSKSPHLRVSLLHFAPWRFLRS